MNEFLTAAWEDLVMANYEVDPALLEDFLPGGTELDFYDGKCFASLVAFKFLGTKIKGVSIPFHSDFEEVNLRFYVKRETREEIRRGVVFIKEIVPKAAITLVAKIFYGEPYETWEMSHQDGNNELTYWWSDESIENRLYVEFGENLGVPDKGSGAEFITEHYWGYTKRGENRTDEYQVRHPKWELSDINYAEIEVDFGNTYGKQFEFLSETEPDSILLARGSPISVYHGAKLRI